MARFDVIINRKINQCCHVEVEADTPEEARTQALKSAIEFPEDHRWESVSGGVPSASTARKIKS